MISGLKQNINLIPREISKNVIESLGEKCITVSVGMLNICDNRVKNIESKENFESYVGKNFTLTVVRQKFEVSKSIKELCESIKCNASMIESGSLSGFDNYLKILNSKESDVSLFRNTSENIYNFSKILHKNISISEKDNKIVFYKSFNDNYIIFLRKNTKSMKVVYVADGFLIYHLFSTEKGVNKLSNEFEELFDKELSVKELKSHNKAFNPDANKDSRPLT